LPIFVDKEIFEHEYFMFNPGDATKTIRIKTSDLMKIYESLENSVKLFDFTGEEAVFEEIV
jgi:prolyl-tRNA editing enzyme YbaK/EbsC (Cys-tRNA(Pro) deacylase)